MPIRLLLLGLISLLSFNSFAACTTYWNAEALSDTQVDSIALYNLRGATVAHVTNAGLKRLADIKNRLAFAANVKAPLWLCDDNAPNAYAEPNLKLVIFTIGMLNMLEWNADAIAGVMSHEIAHLALGHSGAARGKKALETLKTLTSVPSSGNVKLSGLRGIAPIKLGSDDLKTLFRLLYFQISRSDEQQADNEGIKLMTRVGLNPEGVLNAQLALLRRFGNQEGGFFDLHPSLKDRVRQSMKYLATDTAAKGLTAQIRYENATNEEYSAAAEDFIKSGSWKKLGALTAKWLAHSDENAAAFYYRGIYESAGLKRKTLARRSFYRALSIEPDNAKVRLELCVALFEEGQKLNSTYCYRNIATDEDKQAFRARTFGEYLWVAGEVEPFTSVVVTRDERGTKYVTNLVELAKRKGLEMSNHFAE